MDPPKSTKVTLFTVLQCVERERPAFYFGEGSLGHRFVGEMGENSVFEIYKDLPNITPMGLVDLRNMAFTELHHYRGSPVYEKFQEEKKRRNQIEA